MRRTVRRMAMFHLVGAASLFLVVCAAGQTMRQDLAAFVEKPAVTGNEQELAAEIRERLKSFHPKTDNLGNVYVTLGSGGPHRLIVAPMDEPGYIVSGVTEDGYLRVQRLPQQAPHGLFDQSHAAQPIVIQTRGGKWVPGVVAGLSTHLQGGRRDAPRGAHPDEMFIDIGAGTAEEARRVGVDLLDPLALERRVYQMGFGKLTATAIGDRFGVSALVELLRRVDPAKLKGALTVAFLAQQWAGSRGLDRLTQHINADEVIYVGRLLARRGGAGPATAAGAGARRGPEKVPGSGVLLGVADPNVATGEFAAELERLAQEHKISLAADFSTALPRVSYTQGPVLPKKFAHLGIATAWASTPAETIDLVDLQRLADLLEAYAQGSVRPVSPTGIVGNLAPNVPQRPMTPPAITEILKELVESYGVSGSEGPVRETLVRLLPPWAKPETDESGNLILRVGTAGAGSKAPRIVFVAHSDEIGYVVRAIAEDGRLVVRSLGGGIPEFFAGHALLVPTANGMRPGVMELPVGWEQPNFEWPRGPQAGEAGWRVDVGARSPMEVQQLGIKLGDTLTVPKKYRPLAGFRANGRSFDDRVGSTALVAAAWALGPPASAGLKSRDVTFLWATREEIGLQGALEAAARMAAGGTAPDYVFAVDTFVSSDSPLESKRFADAKIGAGFVIRAVDNSNIARRELVDRLVQLARENHIPVQYGVTGGGNDGAAFLRHGATDIPISWPLRYSHSPGELIDTRDVEALARIVAVIARDW